MHVEQESLEVQAWLITGIRDECPQLRVRTEPRELSLDDHVFWLRNGREVAHSDVASEQADGDGRDAEVSSCLCDERLVAEQLGRLAALEHSQLPSAHTELLRQPPCAVKAKTRIIEQPSEERASGMSVAPAHSCRRCFGPFCGLVKRGQRRIFAVCRHKCPRECTKSHAPRVATALQRSVITGRPRNQNLGGGNRAPGLANLALVPAAETTQSSQIRRAMVQRDNL